MKRKTMIALVAVLLLTAQCFAVNTDIYSVPFADPSSDKTHPTDLSQRWSGLTLADSKNLADSFRLDAASVVMGATVWSYSTFDGSSDALTVLQYQIYGGDTQPTGAPLAFGMGTITSSTRLTDHRTTGLIDNLYVTQTVFDLVAPVALNSGTTYWLAICALVDIQGVSSVAQWANAVTPGGDYMRQDGTDWTTMAGDRAFSLSGETRRDPVPDGGASALLLGLAVVPLLLKRQAMRDRPCTIRQFSERTRTLS